MARSLQLESDEVQRSQLLQICRSSVHGIGGTWLHGGHLRREAAGPLHLSPFGSLWGRMLAFMERESLLRPYAPIQPRSSLPGDGVHRWDARGVDTE